MQVMGIRSVIEDFSVFTTGIFMSGYYVGYFVGSRTTPNFVSKVGHIRVFAAFASLASLSALIAVIYVNPFMYVVCSFSSLISVYSTKAGFTLFETSILLFIATISGVIGQGPIGYFSDVYDRRKVIVITTLGGSAMAFFSILTSNDPLQNTYYMDEFALKKLLFFLFVGAYTSFCLPLFSLNLCHTK